MTPRYEVLRADGPDHERQWTVAMIAGDFLRTEGVGASKKAAERAAAREALAVLDARGAGEGER
ncbi:MAG: putative dsRNA-binding protein [Polyangiales bacterium]